MRDDEIALGLRHASLWSTAANEFGDDWLRQQGRPRFGMSDRGRAVARIGCVTISEDGEGGFEWCVEKPDLITYGRIDAEGRKHIQEPGPMSPILSQAPRTPVRVSRDREGG